jgi:hypothetical protein
MPVLSPPTVKQFGLQSAPSRKPQVAQIPNPQQATLQALLAVLNDMDQQLATLVMQTTPTDSGPPQGALVIDSAAGTVNSDVIQRASSNMVLEVYASGTNPAATVTVLDSAIGGTPTQAADPQAVRTLTGYTKYLVGGLQDEIMIRVAPTAGVWSVKVSWTDTTPGPGQGIAAATYTRLTDGTNSVALTPSGALPTAGGTLTGTITGTSPASATTAVIGAPLTGLGPYRSILILATIQGGTGGTLDLYLQASPDGGTTWVDYAHFAQLAAAAAQVNRLVTVSKAGNSGAAPVTVGTGLTPALAASTVVGGDFGDRLRLIGTGGAGTNAGAAQTILAIASS